MFEHMGGARGRCPRETRRTWGDSCRAGPGGGGLEGGVHGDGEQQGGGGPGARGRNRECVTGTEFQLGK